MNETLNNAPVKNKGTVQNHYIEHVAQKKTRQTQRAGRVFKFDFYNQAIAFTFAFKRDTRRDA
jgi:hypothetical protein